MDQKFKKHPMGTQDSQPRAVIVIVFFGAMFMMVLCVAAMPFFFQLWRASVMP